MSTKVFTYAFTKAIYIVDYQTFDAVIDLGFRMTVKERFQIRHNLELEYPNYGAVKRILSNLICNKTFSVETHKHPHFYTNWLVDIKSAEGVDINALYESQVKAFINAKS